jgi:hypothetical protein
MSDPIDTGGEGLKDLGGLKKREKAAIDLDKMDLATLLQLRSDIDKRLPATNLRDFNVEEATLIHYHTLQSLQGDIQGDDSVPANQRAQVANSISAALRDIIKMRNEIYNAEQFRRMEAALAKALRGVAPELREAFFAIYGKTAEEMANVGPSSTP